MGFKGGLAWIKPSKKDMAVTFSYFLNKHPLSGKSVLLLSQVFAIVADFFAAKKSQFSAIHP